MQLGNRAFFNLFARVVTATNRNRDCDEWQIDGVHWQRERFAQWAATSFQVEVHRLAHTRPAWTLLFVRETWWAANRSRAIRDACWTHLEAGSRRDVLKWFQAREAELVDN